MTVFRCGLAAGALAMALEAAPPAGDWLINPMPFKTVMPAAQLTREVVLQNGLVRRQFAGGGAMTTVALDNLTITPASPTARSSRTRGANPRRLPSRGITRRR